MFSTLLAASRQASLSGEIWPPASQHNPGRWLRSPQQSISEFATMPKIPPIAPTTKATHVIHPSIATSVTIAAMSAAIAERRASRTSTPLRRSSKHP